MALLKRLKPVTPGQRGTVLPFYRKLLSKGNSPNKKLTKGFKRSFGRNNRGVITMRHRQAGHKRLYRDVDFKQDKFGIVGVVESIEYDPNRTTFISLVCYRDGERRYILAPDGIKVGDEIVTKEKAPIAVGNRMFIKNIPIGVEIHNVELKINGGGKIARSAGSSLSLLGYDTNFAQLKMPSGEVRKVPSNCFASVGSMSNKENRLRVIGKAGRNRWMGRRPVVRGAAMNAADHPHGGGEGKAPRGRKRAITKWGKPSGKMQKTRKKNKYSNSLIVQRRKIGKRR